MKMKAFLPLFLGVVALQAPLFGAEISLDDAFSAALKQSESLASQQELVTQAEERYKQAVGNVLPSVKASGLWMLEQSRNLPAGQSDPMAQQGTSGINASQPLFRGFREYAALRQTKGGVLYQELGQQWAALQLYSDTSQAYFLILALEKDLATQVGEIDLYDKRIAELRNFVRIGRSRDTEILSVQSAQAILKAQIEQSKALIASARELFAFLTGLPADSILNDTATVPANLDPVESFLTEIPKRPDIKAAAANIELSKEGVNIAKGQHLPNVDLGANYYFQRPSGAQQYVGWDAEIAVTLPLFSGGIIAAQTRQAESQVRQAELALQQQSRLASQAIRSAYDNLRYDLSQATALEEAWKLAEKNYKAESRDYSNGLVTNLELLQALTSFQDTQRAMDRARYAALTDFNRLKSLTAKIAIPGAK